MPLSPSPIVQSYLNRNAQPEQGAPASAEQLFEKRFGDAAFASLRSRYTRLIQYVVTFRVLDSDVKKGAGLGVFIIQSGSNVVYLPVVMADGAIVSCELVYDKDADQFLPLTEQTVNVITRENMLTSATMMRGQAHVEDTRELFRDLVRPPASSNVVLAAAGDGVAALPNAAKTILRTWLNEHPDTLAKIAAFCDAEALGRQLAITREPEAEPLFLTREGLSKEAAAALNTEERRLLLQDGYLVKRAADADTTVTPSLNISSMLENELQVELWESGKPCETVQSNWGLDVYPVETFQLLTRKDEKLVLRPALGFDGVFLFPGGTAARRCGPLLVHGPTKEVARGFIEEVGGVGVAQLQGKLDSMTGDFQLLAFIPGRNGEYSRLIRIFGLRRNQVSVQPMDKTTVIRVDGHGDASAYFCVSSDISSGYVQAWSSVYVPADTLFAVAPAYCDPASGIFTSLDELRHWVSTHGTTLQTISDGPTTQITDTGTKKTARFLGKTAAARWLSETYGLSQDQVSTVLDNHLTTILRKQAFAEEQADPATGLEVPSAQPQAAMASPMGQGGLPAQQYFDPEPLQTAADLGDPDIMDTGILASFAQDPDIKELIIDYLPDFLHTLDRIGRIIVLMCLQKDVLEEFYGHDKYAQLLSDCRRMMRLFGEITDSLKRYTSMA